MPICLAARLTSGAVLSVLAAIAHDVRTGPPAGREEGPRLADVSGGRPVEAGQGGRRVAGIVVLDAGHGGVDGGAVGAAGTLEKDVVLDVAERAKARLQKLGVLVELTRADDSFVPLAARAEAANALDADAFVSLHMNSCSERRVSGVETWVLALPHAPPAAGEKGPAGAVARETRRRSRALAEALQRALVGALGQRDRGVREGGYAVLALSSVPAALVEAGFISHPATERAALTAAWREGVARAVADAVAASGLLRPRLVDWPAHASEDETEAASTADEGGVAPLRTFIGEGPRRDGH